MVPVTVLVVATVRWSWSLLRSAPPVSAPEPEEQLALLASYGQALAFARKAEPHDGGPRQLERWDVGASNVITLALQTRCGPTRVRVQDLSAGGLAAVVPSDCELRPDETLEAWLEVGGRRYASVRIQVRYVVYPPVEESGRRVGFRIGPDAGGAVGRLLDVCAGRPVAA